MVNTRSGRRYDSSKSTKTENVRISINNKRTSSKTRSKTRGRTSRKSVTDEYIFRTINIEDMEDFEKVHQPYEHLFYIIESDEDKEYCVYGHSSKDELKEEFLSHLILDTDAISKLACTLHLVMSNDEDLITDLLLSFKQDVHKFKTTDLGKFMRKRDKTLQMLSF